MRKLARLVPARRLLSRPTSSPESPKALRRPTASSPSLRVEPTWANTEALSI